MVMPSFDQMPAEGVVHGACRHLLDAALRCRAERDAPRPAPHWCVSHAAAAGLMCPEDAGRHESEFHHGDAYFTTLLPMPNGVQFEDGDGRRVALDPDDATIALMVFYAD